MIRQKNLLSKERQKPLKKDRKARKKETMIINKIQLSKKEMIKIIKRKTENKRKLMHIQITNNRTSKLKEKNM